MTNITKIWLMQISYPACKELKLFAGKGLVSSVASTRDMQLLLRFHSLLALSKGHFCLIAINLFDGKRFTSVLAPGMDFYFSFQTNKWINVLIQMD